MGMLDAITPFSESFKEGDPFTLEDAKLGPAIKTDYGTDNPVQLKIQGKWYSLFGAGLRSQLERMDDDDKRAMRAGNFHVKVARSRTRAGQPIKLLVPAETRTDESGNVLDPDSLAF